MHNLSTATKRIRLPLDTTTTYVGSAGTTDLTSEGVDMAGFEAVLLRVAFGAITSSAVTSIKAAQSSDDGSTDAYSDIAGSAVTVADTDDNKVFEIDLYRPGKRYVEIIIDRGTANAVVDYMEAILYRPIHAPPTQTSLIGGTDVLNTPAEGTA